MPRDRIVIRAARKTDSAGIAEAERRAFGRDDEARLALALISGKGRTISVVAACGETIVGHVLLCEIGAPVRSMALAPLGVVPEFREMLIGSRLVADGLERARKAGYQAVFVLGDNLYYERFGFSSALADAFDVEWQGPHFMALELTPGALAGKSGTLVYPAQFSEF